MRMQCRGTEREDPLPGEGIRSSGERGWLGTEGTNSAAGSSLDLGLRAEILIRL
ncbi:MAG: hypothetical protein KUG81_05430 [Gammaproteobacteria bacterium]|nr:hypothetical protein [Gammaproteobacteria bacterium]